MVVRRVLDVVSHVPPESVGRSEVYLAAVGEATLVLELRDSVTESILARVADRRAAESAGGTLAGSNPVTNASDVQRAVYAWAGLLRERLDAIATLESTR